MMQASALPAAGLLAIDNPAHIAPTTKSTGYYASVEAVQANDAVPVREYASEWTTGYSPRSGENLGLLSVRAETGWQWTNSRLGVVYRAEALVQANRDTHDFVWQFDTGQSFGTARTYHINYRIHGFEASGLRFSHQFSMPIDPAWHLQVGVGASLLTGKRLKIETVSGQVLVASNWDAHIAQNLQDSHQDISGNGKFNPPFGAQPGVSGQGYSSDVGLVLQHSSGLVLEAAINDVQGYIHWKNLPSYVADYNTATQSYDAKGYVQFNPSASSQSRFIEFEQLLHPKIWLAARYPVGHVECELGSSLTQGQSFPQWGLTYTAAAPWHTFMNYDTHFGTLELGLRNTWLDVSFRSDHLDLNQAKAYGVAVGFHLGF